jgi:hypothetical protein
MYYSCAAVKRREYNTELVLVSFKAFVVHVNQMAYDFMSVFMHIKTSWRNITFSDVPLPHNNLS